MLATPLAGAGAALVAPLSTRRASQIAIAASTLTVAGSLWVWWVVRSGGSGYSLESDASWIPPVDVRWRLGVDALSAPLVVVTAVLSWCCLMSLLHRAPEGEADTRVLVALVLVIEAASLGTFLALDLIVFFIFFELVLIPMWFVIAGWGDRGDEAGRHTAATRFLVVTVGGSALVLVAFLLLHADTGTFDLTRLPAAAAEMSRRRQVLVAGLLMVGFGAKMPLWPLHFWLPDAHSKAPTVGSVLLAGVLLKLGSYGILRLWYDVVPAGALDVAPYLGAVGVVGIVYGSLACLAQRDVKRLVAYSSIGHMGFVALAVSTLSAQGMAAANFANVAHGAITGLLFFLVGAVKDREGSTDFAALGRGMYARTPRLAGLLGFAALASLGLPGLAGFWGEMLAMLASYSPAPELPRVTYRIFMALAGVGAVLTTAYFLAAVRRLSQGVPDRDATTDVVAAEWLAWAPLLVLTVALGVAPTLMLWSADTVSGLT